MPKSNWVLLASLMAAAPAFAAPPDDAAAPPMVAADRPVATPVDEIDGAAGMRDGSFLPLTVAARIGEQRVMGVALGGYDTTGGGAGGARFESVVEGALAGRFALRVGVEYAPPDAQWSPSVGARVAILRQERFGVDLSIAALYKKAGFSEPDGEIEIIVMLARRWNRFGLFGNLAYGQGLQAAERDGEVRVALLYQLTRRFHLGLDARGRFDLGSKGGGGVDKAFDLIVGPVAGVTVGHFVFLAQAGGRMAVVNENPIGGFTALGGVGAVY